MADLLKNTIDKIKAHKLYAVSTLLMALIVTIMMIVSGKATSTATAGVENIVSITAPAVTVTATREHFKIPIMFNDGLSVTVQRGIPLDTIGISKNPEVTLTAQQDDFAQKFGKYLASIGESAVVTSGERSPENQLGLIKDRIAERGAETQFPDLQDASLADTKVWVQAWKWLRSKHVPVNAPQEVPGERLAVSNHLKGMAMDFIGGSGTLDDLHQWLINFSRTPAGRTTALAITTIAREPGCVHINLKPRG